MQAFKKIGESVLFGCLIFFVFILLFEQLLSIPLWLQVLGRMHPVFLHFPIVLLLLSFITIWLPLNAEQNFSWLDVLKLIAALFAVVTAIMGLLLSISEQDNGDVLQWHKWSGAAVVLFAFLFYTFRNFFRSKKIAAKTFTLAGTFVIVVAGHFGAEITHGEDYLLSPIEDHEKKIVPLDKAVVFNDLIEPVLQEKCFSCHSKSSMKGGLLLSDTTGILNGGKTGALFLAGKPDSSLIMQRLQLPLEDKHHMPPNTKAQLSAEEISLLGAWIKSGAMFNEKLISLPEQDSFRILATHYLSPSGAPLSEPVYDFTAADEKTITSLNNNYRVLEPQGINSPALSVHFYGRNNYSSKTLEELLKVKEQITELNLAHMPVTNADVNFILQMPHLQKLNLNYTNISDSGVEQLNGLKNLKELSVSGTSVTKNIFSKLLLLPQLNYLFAWNTKIDSTQAASITSKNNKLKIETGFVDNGKDTFALSAPMIKAPQGIFKNSISVTITHPFKGAEIRYTLDGTVPDSTTSLIYKQPIVINNNTTINARAFKKGWFGSDAAQAAYIKKGFVPDSVEMLSKTDEKYSPPPKILFDDDLADINFTTGGWLASQKNDVSFLLYFKNTVTAKNVLLNMLNNTGSYIFPPVKIEIWGGTDKTNLKLLGTVAPKVPVQNQAVSFIQPQVSFSPAQVKYLKIVVQHLKALPAWHDGKGQPAWVFISEVVIN